MAGVLSFLSLSYNALQRTNTTIMICSYAEAESCFVISRMSGMKYRGRHVCRFTETRAHNRAARQ